MCYRRLDKAIQFNDFWFRRTIELSSNTTQSAERILDDVITRMSNKKLLELTKKKIEELLAELPSTCQEVIRSFYFQLIPMEKFAEEKGISRVAGYNRLKKALNNFALNLLHHGVGIVLFNGLYRY